MQKQHKKNIIIIIDIKNESSFYRLANLLRRYHKPILLVPVHVLQNMQEIENIFCISSIAQIREGYLYPNQDNCFLAKELPKRYSPKTQQTVSIAINIWVQTNAKVLVITDSKQVEKAINTQGIDYKLKVIKI